MMRTHTCGELRIEHAGKTVTLSGWVQRTRDLGHFTFVDLRDRYGITQLNISSESPLYDEVKKLGREFVIKVSGKVAERESKNPKLPTGDIEIIPSTLEILNASEVPPFKIENDTDGLEDLRMQYRYLDLRRPVMANRMITRAKVYTAVREYLNALDFVEVETPVLIKSTPEGARDFLVPSRLQPGNFYALPQSPQILKQLLMVGGMDRYFQIVKCFRDEDFRGDRQPEFTQIDCEMSFVTQEDILETFGGMTRYVFQKVLDVELPELPRMTYDEALSKYGTDKPDLRFGAEIQELNESFKDTEFKVFSNVIESSGLIAGIVAKGCAEYSRKQLDALTDFVREPHRGAGGLVWVKYGEDGSVKSSVDKFFSPEFFHYLGDKVGAGKGDLLLIVADKKKTTRKVLGDLRLELAKQNNWIDKNAWSVFWVIDFPLFERDEETGELTFSHHPFVHPNPEDLHLLETEPEKVRARCYDMVMNGNEIVSGSERIYQRDVQDKIFRILGLTEEEIEEKFGFLLNAFRYGAPPHAGCAFGLDRWVMLMTGGETIRDVIAYPKTAGGRDIMMDAPSFVPEKALEELHLKVVKEKEKQS